jgi:hypothetical protein
VLCPSRGGVGDRIDERADGPCSERDVQRQLAQRLDLESFCSTSRDQSSYVLVARRRHAEADRPLDETPSDLGYRWLASLEILKRLEQAQIEPRCGSDHSESVREMVSGLSAKSLPIRRKAQTTL